MSRFIVSWYVIIYFFQAHPSVRIKDGEHTYNPVVCQEENCTGRNKGVHMHCPLCTVAETYQDSVILRAHFRIKHLDKGIDFGGEKIVFIPTISHILYKQCNKYGTALRVSMCESCFVPLRRYKPLVFLQPVPSNLQALRCLDVATIVK